MDIIARPTYLSHIIAHLNRGMMIILVGQRRVGKSFMLLQLKQWLEDNRPGSRVIYINKDRIEFGDIKKARDLYDYALPKLNESCENYLLIDEVQDIEGYEDALRSFHAEDRCQIIATGSNAYIFSTELSTRIGGRYVEIPIYSLSYREFQEFHHLSDCDKALNDYLKVGGLPGLRLYDINNEITVADYIQGVYNTIMMRDVVAREQIRNVPFLENLSRFIADNAGKLISTGSIVKYMRSHGENISESMTASYIRHLCNALVINPVTRYDIHGKKLFELIFKYYFSDLGIRNFLCGFRIRGNIEKVMENAVYLHLLSQGYKVYVGILRAGEVDFVAQKSGKTIYVQVSYLLASDETISREFGNLAAIKDNYEKYVVTMDPVSGEIDAYPGIHHVHLREFLTTDF